MAGFSDAIEQEILKNYFRNTAPTTPANVYISLHTADPTDAGTGTEVSTTATGYARVAATTGAAGGSGSVFGAPTQPATAYQVANASAITFPTPTGNWGTVTYFGIWTAATAGTMIVSGALSTSRTINNGDSAPSFAVGALVISVD